MNAERLMRDWTSPIYAFFKPIPAIEYHDKRRCHVFKCAAHGCKHKHVKSCWGEPALQSAMASGNTEAACEGPIKSLLETGSIRTSFTQKGKGKVTYSHRQHTCAETRYVVRWVSESLRPFKIVNDCGFNALMKTGCPEYYLPSLQLSHTTSNKCS
ncbi:uncharacterized protein F5147DRAFT_744555 [Suillus discolor]|uniref:Uncharacterized protein n=1 Tax=Suillus discolor TaxID=1912936 RepID=A0A9P7FCA9_9AGAM|nr:uncharacterized protein F5147DRAFT_744555 [Suillus discolor]KAG2112269.1 hypothetical protein F5147DRAFT_744555 [Suillus discolor]